MTEIDDLIGDGVLTSDVPLGPFTTYKSGGPASWFAEVNDRKTLGRLLDSGIAAREETLVLGRGSNLVVADDGFHGLVIRLGGSFTEFEIDGFEVTAGSAVPLPRLARSTVEAGVAGLEFFVGVPGSVGGAIRQNAGCFGTETKDRLIAAVLVDLITGNNREANAVDLDMSYRHSNVGSHELVVEARFEGHLGTIDESKKELRRITRWRKDNQPGGTFNAGSVFKNPAEISAGELIESVGLKGTKVGEVSVSTKHANFFVAGAGATSANIAELVELVKDQVFEATGTILETEVQFVGFDL